MSFLCHIHVPSDTLAGTNRIFIGLHAFQVAHRNEILLLFLTHYWQFLLTLSAVTESSKLKLDMDQLFHAIQFLENCLVFRSTTVHTVHTRLGTSYSGGIWIPTTVQIIALGLFATFMFSGQLYIYSSHAFM